MFRLVTLFIMLFGTAMESSAATHQLIVGTFGPKFLYTLEFDDVARSLDLVASTETTVPNGWITLSHDKKNLYGTAWEARPPYFVSFSLGQNASSIKQDAIIYAGGECNGTSTYVVADPTPPYAVYGCFFYNYSGCGTVLSVDGHGKLDGVIQNYTYYPSSAVHGTALSPDSELLYSADLSGNSIWTHQIQPDAGALSIPQGDVIEAPLEGAHPRHLAVHPSGKSLYAVFEGSSEVGEYSIDEQPGFPSLRSKYSFLPAGKDPIDFKANEVALSSSNTYLWATTRAADRVSSGYISLFTIDNTTGVIVKQNFVLPTTSSGGYSNSISPSPFSDRFAALADSQYGFVEIWELSDDLTGASVVARLDLPFGDPPSASCCANVVWYS